MFGMFAKSGMSRSIRNICKARNLMIWWVTFYTNQRFVKNVCKVMICMGLEIYEDLRVWQRYSSNNLFYISYISLLQILTPLQDVMICNCTNTGFERSDIPYFANILYDKSILCKHSKHPIHPILTSHTSFRMWRDVCTVTNRRFVIKTIKSKIWWLTDKSSICNLDIPVQTSLHILKDVWDVSMGCLECLQSPGYKSSICQ